MMSILVSITETLLFISFAMLIGSLVLYIVPERLRPDISFPMRGILFCLLAIAVLPFFPVLQIWFHTMNVLGNSNEITFYSMVFNYTAGQSWVLTAISSLVFYLFLRVVDLRTSRIAAFISLLWAVYLLLVTTWSSHVASLTFGGFITQSVHNLAFSIWLGILAVVSWFGKSEKNWSLFLRWYTPLAIICVIVVTLAGLILMNYVVPEYWNSWLLPYGEVLLWKHLLYAFLLVIAFINAFLLRQKVSFSWLRAETIVGALILISSACLGQLTPPYVVQESLAVEYLSPIFQKWYSAEWKIPLDVTFQPSIYSLVLFSFSILFLFLLVYTYIKKLPPSFFVSIGIMSILSLFFALLASITPA